MPTATVYLGDALERLRQLPDESVHCVVTSPPYYSLRDYGIDGQIGLEPSITLYVEKIVEVFREIRRVLVATGTAWVNLGDTYASRWPSNRPNRIGNPSLGDGRRRNRPERVALFEDQELKDKDLMLVPARIALALQADGWWCRADLIWEKPNAMPEGVRDRPHRSHDYVFLFSKSRRYFYDREAVMQPASKNTHGRGKGLGAKTLKVPAGWDSSIGAHHGSIHRAGRSSPMGRVRQNASFLDSTKGDVAMRNLRSVWRIPTKGFNGAHFATFPPDLALICIKAGTPPGGIVLDPFVGSGTTLMVAGVLGFDSIGIELKPDYARLIPARVGMAADLVFIPGLPDAEVE